MLTWLAVAQFVLTAWRRVLTPFQAASITVQSYPGKADILAMIKCNAHAPAIARPQFLCGQTHMHRSRGSQMAGEDWLWCG